MAYDFLYLWNVNRGVQFSQQDVRGHVAALLLLPEDNLDFNTFLIRMPWFALTGSPKPKSFSWGYSCWRMEEHRNNLMQLCRVCGRRLSRKRGKTTHSCHDYVALLKAIMSIDTCLDHEDVHPKRFWNDCYRSMTKYVSTYKRVYLGITLHVCVYHRIAVLTYVTNQFWLNLRICISNVVMPS